MSKSQLGLHAYFDPYWYSVMRDRFEKYLPNYLGHVSLLPEVDTYSLSPIDNGEHLITRDAAGKIHIFRNVCRHQGARLISAECGDEPSGKCINGAITCSLHQWAWNLDGTLQGAPKFGGIEIRDDRLKLDEVPFTLWNGLIFALPKNSSSDRAVLWGEEIAEDFRVSNIFDLGDAVSDTVTYMQSYLTSALVFSDMFCDVRHVQQGHKRTFGSVFDTDTLEWSIGRHHSIQKVGMRQFPLEPGPEYAHWHALTCRILDAMGPESTKDIFRGVYRGFFYPWLTIEVFPFCTAVSAIIPTGPESHRNVVQFFFHKKLHRCAALFAEYRDAQLNAYRASMQEDDDFILRIGAGRRDMHARGEHFRGFAHPGEDKGILAYHEFLQPIEREFWKPRPR